MVIATELCPARSLATLGCTPARNRLVMWQWRRPWNVVRHSGPLHDPGKLLAEVARVDDLAGQLREHQIGLAAQTELQPLLELPHPVRLEDLDHRGR